MKAKLDKSRAPPHSHSIVLSYGNALIYQRKFFRHTAKNRLADPSKIRALEFKNEFHRFGLCSVSGTIGSNRSISSIRRNRRAIWLAPENTVSVCGTINRASQPEISTLD